MKDDTLFDLFKAGQELWWAFNKLLPEYIWIKDGLDRFLYDLDDEIRLCDAFIVVISVVETYDRFVGTAFLQDSLNYVNKRT